MSLKVPGLKIQETASKASHHLKGEKAFQKIFFHLVQKNLWRN